MIKNNVCPKCGCTEIGEGKLYNHANMMPVNDFFSCGSKILADICTECGYIIEMRVDKPHKFK